MTEELKPTGGQVVGFLSTVAGRGDMNANTAGAMKAAVKEVLGAVHPDGWEGVDVSKIDLDQYAERFARLRMQRYKADSLKVYQSRFRNAISMFLEWRANPAEWKYRAERPYRDRKRAREQRQQSQNGSGRPAAGTPPSSEESEGARLIEYPYPLRRDLMVTLHLPADLTRQESKRLQSFIESLALDERAALPAGPGNGAS